MAAPDRRLRTQIDDRFAALGRGPFEKWATAQRRDGQSWARIARTVRRLTGVDVSHESLRRWFVALKI